MLLQTSFTGFATAFLSFAATSERQHTPLLCWFAQQTNVKRRINPA